jgi:Leucine-rich repeat (LRR) protein
MVEEERVVIKPGVCKEFLNNFKAVGDGECFMFNDINMSFKKIEQLNKACDEVKEVETVDLSENNLTDIKSLETFQNLTSINVSNNKIKGLSMFTVDEAFPNLKWVNLSNNQLKEMPNMKLPKLEYLDISQNLIMEKVAEGWTGHPNVRKIKSVETKFKTFAVFKNCPNLEELYMAKNQLTTLGGWESLPKLKILHLRGNKIDKIQGGGEEEVPPLDSLEYLNLRNNGIKDLETLVLAFSFPTLQDLNVKKNPVNDNYSSFNVLLAEVLMKKSNLKRFCKVDVEEKHKLEAVFLGQYRWEEAEKKRIE